MTDLAYIIPAFNASTTVGQTLHSVLAQRGPTIHAIVVDDGSTDSTGDIARAQRDWRIEVVRQANAGLAAARNTGFEVLGDAARAVCFLDADDTVEQGHAQALMAALDASPTRPGSPRRHAADVAACGYRMVGPNLEDLGWTIDIADADWNPTRLIEFNPLAVGGVAVRAQVLREHAGQRPFDESLPVHEDWALWLRLSATGLRWGGAIHEHLFNYRLRPGSLSRAVQRMWTQGRRVIASAPLPEGDDSGPSPHELRRTAQRRWALRHLARAAVADATLVPTILTELDSLGDRTLEPDDRAVFLGALRHAFMLENALGPAGAAAHEAQWRDHARAALAPWPQSHDAIDSLSLTSWDAVASRLARLLGRIGGRGRLAHLRPVVAGMGRNGRALAMALAARSIAFGWLDDDRAARCPVHARRLSWSDVAPRHLVIVTPTAPQAMIDRLRDARCLAMTPAELVESGHQRSDELSPRRVA